MAAHNFAKALEFVLLHEGGFVSHPQDPGGATNKGVTIATFRAWRRNTKATIAQLKAITDAEVSEIYYDWYWMPVRGDALPNGVDVMAFDKSVNAGPARAARHLQIAAGLTGNEVDGRIGPRSLFAVAGQDPALVIASMGEQSEQHYRSLRTFDVFGRGWLNRLTDRLALAQQLLGPSQQS